MAEPVIYDMDMNKSIKRVSATRGFLMRSSKDNYLGRSCTTSRSPMRMALDSLWINVLDG